MAKDRASGLQSSILLQRLFQQGITRPRFASPEAVVSCFGAVQAQEYPGAKWSLAMRIGNISDGALDQAFNDGRILRTHVMRPTWHFVTPEDIRWMLDLTAERVRAKMAYNARRIGLDAAIYSRANALFEREMQGGRCLSRPELEPILAGAGIPTGDLRLGHILMNAELDGLLVSGPRRGKQMSYALLAERAPQARALSHEEALAELARRYFTAHGPAAPRDFAWWSGLTIADAKTAIAMLGAALEMVEIEGEVYWFSAQNPPQAEPSPEAYLLPTYDELLIGYEGFDRMRRGGGIVPPGNTFLATLVIGGEIMGGWRRTLHKDGVEIQLLPFAPLTPDQCELVSAAAEKYGAFLGLPVKEIMR